MRHPARWPLLIVGAILLVPMVWMLAEVAAGFNETGPLIASTILFLLGLAFLFLASTTYTRLTRGLTLLLSTLIVGMILAVAYRGFGWIVLMILGLFGWIAFVTLIRPPERTRSTI